MSVHVKNIVETEKFTLATMKPGVLYKLASGAFSTVYTKTLQGLLVWFENGSDDGSTEPNRIGSSASYPSLFVEAPKGTEVLLKN